ncbi:MAG: hypothetical protein MJ188_07315 [Treponema sp.]|nr:hypothetical protein [Treponema sp.]
MEETSTHGNSSFSGGTVIVILMLVLALIYTSYRDMKSSEIIRWNKEQNSYLADLSESNIEEIEGTGETK